MSIKKISITQKLSLISDFWNPRIAGELNGQYIKLVKFLGEYIWHKHVEEDEMFLVVRGKFTMELRDQTIELNEGEFLIIPKNTEHKPIAQSEVHVLVFEPIATVNTGDQINERTKHILDWI